MAGGPEAVSRMEESASSQPVAIVTGASRDIGWGIAEELSREGFDVIANHRDPQKEKRSTEIRGIIESTGGEWHVGDITTPQGRSGLVDIVDRRGGKLDLLILNAAGPSRELNVVANLALVNAFLPRMNKGGAIIFMQSTVGHFVDLIDPSQLTTAGYENVAPSKNEAEKELRKKLTEADERGVKIFFPCPPEVSDTTNIRLFNYRDKDASAKSAAFSRSLGLPERMTIRDVGKKVAELVRRKDELPQGYTDFFNGTIDARPVLETYSYGENAMYVDTVEADGTGHAFVTDLRLKEASQRLVEEVSGNVNHATATVKVTEEHTRGHFKVLPGHKRVGMAIAAARDRYEREHPGKTLELTSIGHTDFAELVATGNIVEVAVEKDKDTDAYGAALTSDGEVITAIAGMRFREVERTDRRTLVPNQLIEMGAQAAGLSTGEFKLGQRGRLPMFNSFGDVDFYRMPGKGEVLTIKPAVKIEGDTMTGSFDIYSGEELVARVGSLEAKMWPSRAVRMMIGNLLRKSASE